MAHRRTPHHTLRTLKLEWLTVFLPSVMTLVLLALQATGAPATNKNKEKDSFMDDMLEKKFDLFGKVKDLLGFGSGASGKSAQPHPPPPTPRSENQEKNGWIKVEPPPL